MENVRLTKKAMLLACVSLPMLGGLVGCPEEVLPGDAAQATAVRASMATGMADLAAVKSEVLTELARFGDSAAGQLLISGVSEIKPVPVTQAQVSALYGTLSETAVGVFNLIPDTSAPEINVLYLNGIDVKFGDFKFDAQNNVKHFNITFNSNNRSINTPELEEVGGWVANDREDLTNHIPPVDSYKYALGTLGFAFIDSAGVDVSYVFGFTNEIKTRSATEVTKTASDFALEKKPGGDSWLNSSTISYVPTSLTGIYAAKSMTKVYNETVNGKKVNYLASTELDFDGTAPLGSSGSVDYIPADYSRVKYTVNRTAYKVAGIEGGPHTCDLNTSTGSGVLPIVMTWTNQTTEDVLPGHFTCQDAVLKF